jgi:ribonucleoside-diphosphate reductase alpha chain
MDQKQKITTKTQEDSRGGSKEVESINGYYKKVVLNHSTNKSPIEESTQGRQLSDLSLKVFNDRYALKDKQGDQLENTPEEMWKRVSHSIASVETSPEAQREWEEKFYTALYDFKYVPGGRILTGAGSEDNVTYYNCYVLPYPEDSREGIMDSVKNMVEVMARGGGAGVNLSSLRPRGARVRGVNGKASGSVSFGALYSFATGLIIQGGSRRGALMLMLNDDHPDIEEFITVKKTMGQITNANLSVAVSDTFMEAVKKDGDWDLKWEGEVYKTVKASYLWDLITESAHASGEPGCVFMERANKQSNTYYFEDIICVNPCGEQPLPAWGVCNLGSINLVPFVNNGEVDWDNLKTTIHTSIRFMDNVIDATPYAFEENKIAQLNVRRVGLGTMGLADALIKLKIRYGSEEAIDFTEKLYKFIQDETYRASIDVAAEKGSFPDYDRDKFMKAYHVQRLPQDIQDDLRENGIRNGVIQTQAPTGTTSMLAGVSSGIEPVYDFSFKRTDRLGEHIVYHPLYKEWKDAHPDEKDPDYFVNAKQLTPIEHVKMQAMVQKYTDASISKTVNAPEEHTHEDVKELYMQAYELGCKGLAYYRENSRDISVLESLDNKKTKDNKAKKLTQEQSGDYVAPQQAEDIANTEIDKEVKTEELQERHEIEPMSRPEIMVGKTYKLNISYGKLYVTVNDDATGKPFEIFATIGKAGGFFGAKSEAICRLVSLSLRSGIDVDEVIKQLKGIRGPMPSFGGNGTKILSLADAIAHILEKHIKGDQPTLDLGFEAKDKSAQGGLEVEKKVDSSPTQSMADHGNAPECPTCGGVLEMAEGCMLCRGCGFSRCG